MSYVRSSTKNPLGFRPWGAALQPGGLGAFFPNIEGIGHPSVLLDRDSANANAPVPRIYYPPDARLQFSTPRGLAGLGVAILNTARKAITTSFPPSTYNPIPGGLYPVAPGSGNPPKPSPFNFTGSATGSGATGSGGSIVATGAAGGGTRVRVNPRWDLSMVGAPTLQSPALPTSPSGSTSAGSTVQATTAAGATIPVTTSPVPAGYSTSSAYTASDGSIWVYVTSSASWQIAVPAGANTGNTYTDGNGNIWEFGSSGWQATAGSGSASSVGNWFTSSSIVSSVPNYMLVGGAFLAFLVFKKK